MSQQPSPFDPPPMRAEALSDGSPYDERRRPGLLTAIGVISIVVASFGLLFGAGELFQTFVMGTVLSRVAKSMTYTPSANSGPGATTGTTSGAGIDEDLAGMTAPNRAMVLAEMNKLRSLPQPRQEMAEKLLADVGEDAFPFAQTNYTPQRIAGSISESGKLPSADARDDGNHYFVLANGRIEVADDHAVFMPSRRGAQAVRVYRAQPGAASSAAPAPATMPFTLPIFSKRSLTLAYSSGLLNLICALYLMFIGIMVLRDARRGRTMHLVYAVLKLVLIALAVYASWNWYTEQSNAMVGGTPMPGTTGALPGFAIALQATLWNVPGCIYPLALLIVLNLPSVRAYYRTWVTNKPR